MTRKILEDYGEFRSYEGLWGPKPTGFSGLVCGFQDKPRSNCVREVAVGLQLIRPIKRGNAFREFWTLEEITKNGRTILDGLKLFWTRLLCSLHFFQSQETQISAQYGLKINKNRVIRLAPRIRKKAESVF
jgi:hypothetical protein